MAACLVTSKGRQSPPPALAASPQAVLGETQDFPSLLHRLCLPPFPLPVSSQLFPPLRLSLLVAGVPLATVVSGPFSTGLRSCRRALRQPGVSPDASPDPERSAGPQGAPRTLARPSTSRPAPSVPLPTTARSALPQETALALPSRVCPRCPSPLPRDRNPIRAHAQRDGRRWEQRQRQICGDNQRFPFWRAGRRGNGGARRRHRVADGYYKKEFRVGDPGGDGGRWQGEPVRDGGQENQKASARFSFPHRHFLLTGI
mmetsp:Transcript_43475/g.85785  ORF Transcript_43475/g.85785 Transcript_43475/m.85785 type:complete len:258 (+) Transcript_43475:140-913(+)